MAGCFSVKKTASGDHMFKLQASHHEVILTDASYKSKASALVRSATYARAAPMENGVGSVIHPAADATVEDLT